MAEQDYVGSPEHELLLEINTGLWKLDQLLRNKVDSEYKSWTYSARVEVTNLENAIRYMYRTGELKK